MTPIIASAAEVMATTVTEASPRVVRVTFVGPAKPEVLL
jgi:hypothetical protein